MPDDLPPTPIDPQSAVFGEHTGGTLYECIDGKTCEIHGAEPDISADPSGYDAWYERHGLCDYGTFCLNQPLPSLICMEEDCAADEVHWPCTYAQGVIAGIRYASRAPKVAADV